MKKKILSDTLLQIFRTRKRFVFGILISLILETVISLGLPGILSKIIDGLGKQTITWLVAFILFFLAVVVVKGFATVLNSYLSEKMGRSVCDEIRKKLLKKLFQFSVSQHKMSKTGDFFEKIEGDVNVMVGFFSNMLIDIIYDSGNPGCIPDKVADSRRNFLCDSGSDICHFYRNPEEPFCIMERCASE